MSTAKSAVILFASGLSLVVVTSRRLPPAPDRGVTTFPLSHVRVLDGPFKHAQDLNINYVRALEPDRLLAPYRTEAGLEPKAPKYPNWESTGLEGHTAGHYLTALAQIWAATGEPEMKQRLDYMVAELAACQRANGNGYVGAVPGSRQLWDEIAAGTLRVERFAINGKWVPWYNLHKLFAGLRDAHLIGANAEARTVLVHLADWTDRLVSKLSDAQMQEMLGAEHGGMNEVLADVSALTSDDRYLALARRFSHRVLLEHLERHEDTLTGLHANTQIPKAIGYARISELGGEPAGLDAARFFWQTVVRHRTVAFGGNSVREHFNPPDDFSSMIESREGPETCNTYNMLRLTERLFRADAVRRVRGLLRTGAVQSHPVDRAPGARRIRVLHAHPPAALPGVLAAVAVLLVLCRHRHGESRQVRPVHLRPHRRRAVRQPVHRVRAALARTGPRAAAGHELSG